MISLKKTPQEETKPKTVENRSATFLQAQLESREGKKNEIMSSEKEAADETFRQPERASVIGEKQCGRKRRIEGRGRQRSSASSTRGRRDQKGIRTAAVRTAAVEMAMCWGISITLMLTTLSKQGERGGK